MEKQHANMLLDINGRMVRTVGVLSVALCVFICLLVTLILICRRQVSATEECIGPMRLTQEPIQVRVQLDG